jgi:hypothetical protein
MSRIFFSREHSLESITGKTDDGTITFLNRINSSCKQISKELGSQTVGSSPYQFFGAVNIGHQRNAVQVALFVNGTSMYHALFLSILGEGAVCVFGFLTGSLK